MKSSSFLSNSINWLPHTNAVFLRWDSLADPFLHVPVTENLFQKTVLTVFEKKTKVTESTWPGILMLYCFTPRKKVATTRY